MKRASTTGWGSQESAEGAVAAQCGHRIGHSEAIRAGSLCRGAQTQQVVSGEHINMDSGCTAYDRHE